MIIAMFFFAVALFFMKSDLEPNPAVILNCINIQWFTSAGSAFGFIARSFETGQRKQQKNP